MCSGDTAVAIALSSPAKGASTHVTRAPAFSRPTGTVRVNARPRGPLPGRGVSGRQGLT